MERRRIFSNKIADPRRAAVYNEWLRRDEEEMRNWINFNKIKFPVLDWLPCSISNSETRYWDEGDGKKIVKWLWWNDLSEEKRIEKFSFDAFSFRWDAIDWEEEMEGGKINISGWNLIFYWRMEGKIRKLCWRTVLQLTFSIRLRKLLWFTSKMTQI